MVVVVVVLGGGAGAGAGGDYGAGGAGGEWGVKNRGQGTWHLRGAASVLIRRAGVHLQ